MQSNKLTPKDKNNSYWCIDYSIVDYERSLCQKYLTFDEMLKLLRELGEIEKDYFLHSAVAVFIADDVVEEIQRKDSIIDILKRFESEQ